MKWPSICVLTVLFLCLLIPSSVSVQTFVWIHRETGEIGMATFGNTATGGGATVTSLEDKIRGAAFTCPRDCRAESITIELIRIAGVSWTGLVKCAVYEYADSRCIYVAETEEDTITATNTAQWFTFSFDVKPELRKGRVYALFAWAENAANSLGLGLTYSGNGTTGYYKTETYNGWPKPVNGTNIATQAIIYCTYTRCELPRITTPDPAIFGKARFTYTRFSVYENTYAKTMEKLNWT